MPIPEPGWDDEGRRLSPLVDTLAAVVIVGVDSAAAALVAIGLAHAQSSRRRVVIGDLVGELEPLEALIPRHDLHGLSDSFTYGISLNRIGYPVQPGGDLYIMPSGSEPVATAAIIGHPRWQRLVAGFREVDALLVLVAQPGAPGLERLIPMTDGALLVGDTRLEAPSHVIARARPRGARMDVSPAAPVQPNGHGGPAPVVVGIGRAAEARAETLAARKGTRVAESEAQPGGSGRRIGVIVGLAVGTVALLLAVLLAARYSSWGRPNDSAPQAAASAPVPAEQSRLVDGSLADPPTPVENPQDSARAAAYAVVIVAANTAVGANANLLRVQDLPGANASPSIDGGALWYKVFVGAFVERSQAEAFRDSLRTAGRVDETVERIVPLPFAFIVAENIAADSVAAMRGKLSERGIATYALLQSDATARIYAGAFAARDEAMHLAPMLRTAGIQPRIVYRTGRSY